MTMTNDPLQPTAPPINFDQLMEEFDNDQDFAMELAHNFLANAIQQIPIIRQALEDGNLETVSWEAHKLKSGAANLEAHPLAEHARNMEQSANGGLAAASKDHFRLFAAEFQRVAEFIEKRTSMQVETDENTSDGITYGPYNSG